MFINVTLEHKTSQSPLKLLAMHITNQKLSFDIFTVGNVQNIFMEHDLNTLMIFGIKEKLIILIHTMAIATSVTYDLFLVTYLY